MAIVRSKKIFVYGLNSERKAILEFLHQKGVVELTGTENNDALGSIATAKSISQFDGMLNTTRSALEVLDKYAPEKTGMFTSRRILPMGRYSIKTSSYEKALKSALEINQFADKIHENAENIRRIEAKQAALQPYLSLDLPMKVAETRHTYIKMGMLMGSWTRDDIQRAFSENGVDGVYFDVLESNKEETYIWFEYLKDQQKEVFAFLQSTGLQEPSFSLSKHTPKKKTEILEQAKKDLASQSGEFEKKLSACGDRRSDLELLYDHIELRREKYTALSKIGVTESSFVLEGFILDTDAEKTRQALESKYTAYVELEQPEDLDAAPEAFKNNAFVAPVEGITETYSMPNKYDVDPNPIMAFFYYCFFGMCFSDAGYGILVMLACGILGFGKVLEPHKRKSFKMFFYCGISTTFWGLMYGSFFGDAISSFSGGQYTLTPLWIDPISEPLTLLIFSVGIGLITCIIGLGVKFYVLVKQGKVKDAIYDQLCWMLILGGVGVLAVGAAVGIQAVLYAGVVVAIIGVAILVIFHGRDKKNPIMRVLGGILGIYDVTSYVGDILSYSRLMALGLTTGVIGNVVNLLGPVFGELVFGESPLAMIVVVIVFILGHLINFALNMLGAYVHTNRLQYVEFFSKFYEGGGRKFVPFGMNTKYHKFTEEKNN